MSLAGGLLPEFDHEMAGTRKVIERIPEDKLGWKPHEKSTAMGGLATHLANLPGWATRALDGESFDMAPGGEPVRIQPVKSRQEALDMFDRNVSDARAAIAGASDEILLKPWTLLSDGKPVFTMPRIAVLRGFVLNHSIHHRAQLGVYLRLNDVPVPPLYGPTADEGDL
ncbi:MAG TPA: DinB family protein [Blastocatellia bacterium]|nr:DinB family protein [Blastocatellia bacterium]